MKKISSSVRTFALLVAGAGIALPSAAHASGVAAGTPIDNTAEATYTIGGISQTVASNTVSITVDEILDVTVSSLDGGNVEITGNGSLLTLQLSNTGNGPEAYEVLADPALTGDDFDPALIQIAYDSNDNGTYDDGVDAVIPLGGTTPEIAADASLTIFVILGFDGAAPSEGDTADVRLTATAATGSGAPGDVFAGQGVDGVDAIVGTTGAEDNDTGTLIARISAVTLAKSATIADGFGGTQTVPGAVVTYQLVANVTGTASVADLVISDPFPPNTTYQPGSITLEGSGLTDAADSDEGEADTNRIIVGLGTLPGGSSRTITFQVTIDD
jgi:uncharacterized repeat protein (TIGR01451 family)